MNKWLCVSKKVPNRIDLISALFLNQIQTLWNLIYTAQWLSGIVFVTRQNNI